MLVTLRLKSLRVNYMQLQLLTCYTCCVETKSKWKTVELSKKWKFKIKLNKKKKWSRIWYMYVSSKFALRVLVILKSVHRNFSCCLLQAFTGKCSVKVLTNIPHMYDVPTPVNICSPKLLFFLLSEGKTNSAPPW